MSSGASGPTRILNTQVNPYWGMLKKNDPQSGVYIHGQKMPPGFEGGAPAWIPVEFPQVPIYDTQDSTIPLPAGFTLMALLGFSTQAPWFAFQAYDVNAERWIVDKLVDARVVAGDKGFVLIERSPYTFEPDEEGNDAQIFIRVANQAPAVADIQLALYGIVGGATD